MTLKEENEDSQDGMVQDTFPGEREDGGILDLGEERARSETRQRMRIVVMKTTLLSTAAPNRPTLTPVESNGIGGFRLWENGETGWMWISLCRRVADWMLVLNTVGS